MSEDSILDGKELFDTVMHQTIKNDFEENIIKIDIDVFKDILKIIDVLSKGSQTDSINIRESKIHYGRPDFSVYVDFNNFKSGIDLDIVDPKKIIPLLKDFKEDVSIKSQEKQFIIQSGTVKLQVPRQAEFKPLDSSFIRTENYKKLSEITLDKSEGKTIRKLVKNADYIQLLLKDNLLKAIHIPNTAIYIFKEYYISDNDIDETNAEKILRICRFAPLESDAYHVILLTNGEEYILLTNCRIIEGINAITIEVCSEMSEDILII